MDINSVTFDYVTKLFREVVKSNGSDIHLKVGSMPKMRQNTNLPAVPGYESDILTAEVTERIASIVLDHGGRAEWDNHRKRKKAYEFSYQLDTGERFRMTVSQARTGVSMTGRVISDLPQSLAKLQVPHAVNALVEQKAGLVIVTGPTGSGKSTTMAAMIDLINKTQSVHIVSLEDPIEYIHEDKVALVTQREINTDTADYASGLKEALRQDPDVILIGEIRDAETMKIAMRAAETGHLVVTSLHMTTAAETIDRMVGLHPEAERELARKTVASVLRGVVCQRLVPKQTGGQIVINEILLATPPVRDAILDNAPAHVITDIISRSTDEGMQTFDQHIAERLRSGFISLKTAVEYADDEQMMHEVEIPESGDRHHIVEHRPLPALPQLSHPRTSPLSVLPHLNITG